MRVLIAFDVDGTLDTSAGPVKVTLLRELEYLGARIVIVSPSSLRPPGFPERIEGAARADNLKAAARDYPCDLHLYVSDNGDRDQAEAAGFVYVDRLDFR